MAYNWAFIVLLLIINGFTVANCEENLRIVRTSLGDVIGYRADYGKLLNSTGGNDFLQLYYGHADVFLGVPYAKPPVGERRFRRPEPITQFTGDGTPYNATYQHPICPQLETSNTPMSEDCLVMNIFSPDSEAAIGYPVMLWIHGGSLRDGSAREWGIEGVIRNLVSRGVVVVIIQYRLGTLGFFTTMNDEFPPNLGMLDQVEAIRFVKRYISNFGGDPGRLTLFGQSAGAASVSAHTYSPLSQNLFEQAIMESGTIMTCLDGVFGESKNSQKIAKLVCNVDLPANGEQLRYLKDCMMKANYTEFLPFEKEDLLGWKMSVDGYFLPGTPEELHSKRPNIPIIIGSCKDEWSFFDLSMMAEGLKTLNDYNKTSVETFFDTYGSYFGSQTKNVLNLLLAIYETPLLTANNHLGWLKTKNAIFTGAGFTGFIALESSWYLQNNNTNVYMYEFNYPSAVGRIYQVPGWNPVPHTAELPFIWMQKPIWMKAIDSLEVVPDDYLMAAFFGKVWTQFAKTGFRCDQSGICPPWLATILNGNNLQYLAINAQKMMMPNYRPVDRTTYNRVLPALEIQWKVAAQQCASRE